MIKINGWFAWLVVAISIALFVLVLLCAVVAQNHEQIPPSPNIAVSYALFGGPQYGGRIITIDNVKSVVYGDDISLHNDSLCIQRVDRLIMFDDTIVYAIYTHGCEFEALVTVDQFGKVWDF